MRDLWSLNVPVTDAQKTKCCQFAERAGALGNRRGVYDLGRAEYKKRLEVPLGFLKQSLVRGKKVKRICAEFISDHTQLCLEMIDVIEDLIPIVRRQALIGNPNAMTDNCFMSLGIVYPTAQPQLMHCDADGEITHVCAIPMTDFPGQGDTEFGENLFILKGPKMWGGDIEHRGGANGSEHTRVTLFFVLDSKDVDFANPGNSFY
jgi:hypothetical protein